MRGARLHLVLSFGVDIVHRVCLLSLLVCAVPLSARAQFFDPPANADRLAGNAGAGGEAAAGAGGGALADFDSLMNLIQTTIEPDTWEALGGVGTMAPYPAGIIIDPDGLVRHNNFEPAKSTPEQRASRLRAWLQEGDAVTGETWRDAAPIRCVSMRRWMQTLMTASIDPNFLVDEEAVQNVAGLSVVTMLIVTDDDLILAGPVGGFDTVHGWEVDRRSGLPPLRLSAMGIGLSAARHNRPFGCTIDPTPAGLRSAAAVSADVAAGTVAIGQAANSLASALGRQDVRVFGTPANHEVAWLMIEADRHMKQVALGMKEMPEGTANFPRMVQMQSPEQPPTDLLLRLWFTGQPLSMRQTDAGDATIVQLAGTPLQLSGDNELALLTGQRGHRVVDPVTQSFVSHFNDNWSSIRSTYPLYGALESVYRSVALMQLWHQIGVSSDHEVLRRSLLHFASHRAEQLPIASEVDSIAILHRYQHRRRLHHLVLASGGVSVAPTSLVGVATEYAPLRDYARLSDGRPSERWWWNASNPRIQP